MMQTRCCYCHRNAQKFAAQPTLKHAYSHGLCEFHARFEIAKFEIEMRKLDGSVKKRDD